MVMKKKLLSMALACVMVLGGAVTASFAETEGAMLVDTESSDTVALQATYTLTYNTNGGTAIDAESVEAGTEIQLEDKKPTKEGYEFTGWFTDEALTQSATKITVDKDTTVYAGWKAQDANQDAATTYKLTYETNGGTAIAEESVEAGKTIQLEDKKPTKSGYEFTGWFADSALSQSVTTVTVDKDTTVYAGWKLLPKIPTIKTEATYTDQYVISELSKGKSYTTLQSGFADALKAMETYNSDTNHTVANLLNAISALSTADETLANSLTGTNKCLYVTDFFDIDKAGDNVAKEGTKYKVLYDLTGITAAKTGYTLKLLHFNMDKKCFELLDVSTTDTANVFKVLSDNLSPAAFVLVQNQTTTSTTNTAATSPKTDSHSDWTLWMAAAGILAGAGFTVLRRKESR